MLDGRLMLVALFPGLLHRLQKEGRNWPKDEESALNKMSWVSISDQAGTSLVPWASGKCEDGGKTLYYVPTLRANLRLNVKNAM